MLFNKLKKLIDPMIGKTVIHFTTHGCMAHVHEFDYIGRIVEPTYPKNCDGKKFYKVQILKAGSTEKRDDNLNQEFTEIASWYLQNIGGDFYVAYD